VRGGFLRDLGAREVLHAHRVDDEPDTLVLDAGVAVLQRLVEFESVLQPRAAPALHEHAQHQLRVALAPDQVRDLAGGGVGEQQRRLGRRFRGRRILRNFGTAHKLLQARV
jgi:hypothetical protein